MANELPAARLHLAFGSLVKHIIYCNADICNKNFEKTARCYQHRTAPYIPRRDTYFTAKILYHLPGQLASELPRFSRQFTGCYFYNQKQGGTPHETTKWLWEHHQAERGSTGPMGRANLLSGGAAGRHCEAQAQVSGLLRGAEKRHLLPGRVQQWGCRQGAPALRGLPYFLGIL